MTRFATGHWPEIAGASVRFTSFLLTFSSFQCPVVVLRQIATFETWTGCVSASDEATPDASTTKTANAMAPKRTAAFARRFLFGALGLRPSRGTLWGPQRTMRPSFSPASSHVLGVGAVETGRTSRSAAYDLGH